MVVACLQAERKSWKNQNHTRILKDLGDDSSWHGELKHVLCWEETCGHKSSESEVAGDCCVLLPEMSECPNHNGTRCAMDGHPMSQYHDDIDRVESMMP